MPRTWYLPVAMHWCEWKCEHNWCMLSSLIVMTKCARAGIRINLRTVARESVLRDGPGLVHTGNSMQWILWYPPDIKGPLMRFLSPFGFLTWNSSASCVCRLWARNRDRELPAIGTRGIRRSPNVWSNGHWLYMHRLQVMLSPVANTRHWSTMYQ